MNLPFARSNRSAVQRSRRGAVIGSALIVALSPFALASGAASAVESQVSGEALVPTNAQLNAAARSAARKTTALGLESDTVFVGYTPGHSAANNWWSISAGSGPLFHHPPAPGGMWDFETPVRGDSLQGWIPVRIPYTSTGGQNRTDRNRAWWALDYGNIANYAGYSGPAEPIPGGQKRTFGVIGVWHVDGGSGQASNGAPGSPTWAPLAGTRSAWMGLRGHGDTSGGTAARDPLTKNYFNEDVLVLTSLAGSSSSGNDRGFPGYGSQMDQLLYRDIDMSGNFSSSLTISFQYRTNLSTGFNAATATRTGWFDKDPIAPVSGPSNPQLNNFISSSDAGTNAPRDSFMVYVGAPVIGSTFIASNGVAYAVFDPLRRWFAETIRANEVALHREILSRAGLVAPTSFSTTIPNSMLAPILSASGGRVRLAFRVKTNRGFDDEGSAFSSGGAGAAVVDNVTYAISGGPSSPAGWGQFENFPDINNSPAVDALNAWKSTGKPPGTAFHAHGGLGTSLPYDDLCGQPGEPSRICDMNGVVLSGGYHHLGEAAGGLVSGTGDREPEDGAWSPTIQLGGPYPNPQGIQDVAMADPTDDYYVGGDIFTGIFDIWNKGNSWRVGFMSYPANDKNGAPGWGQPRTPSFTLWDRTQECFYSVLYQNARGNGLIRTSNPSGIPDSMRIQVRKIQECYRFAVSAGCSPTDGAYWDNLSLLIVDKVPEETGLDLWENMPSPFDPEPPLLGFERGAESRDVTRGSRRR